MDFKIVTENAFFCNELAEQMRKDPTFFDMFEIEYVVKAQKSARRDLTLTGSHLKKSKLFSQLENMNKTENGEQYLNSKDINDISQETVMSVVGSVLTEGGYVATGDEVTLGAMIENFLKSTEESTENFNDKQWESTFWDDEWLRPDRLTSYLNNNYSKEIRESEDYQRSRQESSESTSVETEVQAYGVGVSASVAWGHSSMSEEEKRKISNSLEETGGSLQWTGEKFQVRPMKLYRVNTNDIKSTMTIGSRNIQLKEYDAVLAIEVAINKQKFHNRSLNEKSESMAKKFQKKTSEEAREIKKDLQRKTAKIDVKIESESINLNKKIKEINESLTSSAASFAKKTKEIKNRKQKWPAGSYCVLRYPNHGCPKDFFADESYLGVRYFEKGDNDGGTDIEVNVNELRSPFSAKYPYAWQGNAWESEDWDDREEWSMVIRVCCRDEKK